jgi:hypothetical protein
MKANMNFPNRNRRIGYICICRQRETRLYSFLAGFLICSLLIVNTGCMNYYKVSRPSEPTPSTLDNYAKSGKMFYLISGDKAFRLNGFQLSQDVVTGYALQQPDYKYHLTTKPIGPNRYIQKRDGFEAKLLKHVLLYVSDYTPMPEVMVQIPFEDIEKIELYDEATGATIASWTLGAGLVTAGGALLIGALAITLKGSCPFIYVFDEETYVFSGEIYSGSTLPQLERHDYLKLPLADRFSDEFNMIITNEVKEIQHTNLIELLVYDHPAGVEVLADKYGHVHALQDIRPPVSAENIAGNNVLTTVSEKDDKAYTGLDVPGTDELTDALILEFPEPGMASEARLVVRAKSSILLDYNMGRFHDLFGRAYPKWYKKQQATPEQELHQWMMDQNIPLSVFIEKNGQWEFLDFFHVTGPMAMKEDVLSIELGEPDGNPLRLKLEFGKHFWEVDFVGIDYLPDAPFISHSIEASSAVDHTGADIRHLIANDDDLYYIQPEVGDEASLYFPLPPIQGDERSVILHSKGHYHILREPTGKPQVKHLKAFREPGAFNRFSNEFLMSRSSIQAEK